MKLLISAIDANPHRDLVRNPVSEEQITKLVEQWKDWNAGQFSDIKRCSEYFYTLNQERMQRLHKVLSAIIERANHCCENCGVANYSLRDGKRIILTIAHLDHISEHCDSSNLRALCQKCNNSYDIPYRV